jgi:hypothetical protein
MTHYTPQIAGRKKKKKMWDLKAGHKNWLNSFIQQNRMQNNIDE